MADAFPGRESQFIAGPFTDAFPVTPDDDNDLPNGVCRGLWVGTAGSVEVITRDEAGRGESTSVTFVGVSGLLPGRFSRVKEGGDADDIVALY